MIHIWGEIDNNLPIIQILGQSIEIIFYMLLIPQLNKMFQEFSYLLKLEVKSLF